MVSELAALPNAAATVATQLVGFAVQFDAWEQTAGSAQTYQSAADAEEVKPSCMAKTHMNRSPPQCSRSRIRPYPFPCRLPFLIGPRATRAGRTPYGFWVLIQANRSSVTSEAALV